MDLPQVEVTERAEGIFSRSKIKEAILAHVRKQAPCAEMWGDPVADEKTNEWIATIALAPSGPAVVMSFGVRLREV